MIRAAFLRSSLLVVLGAAPLVADDLPQPQEAVVLEISGKIERLNRDDAAAFDMPMLRDLEPVTIRTRTIWTRGEQSFTGVELHRLMRHVGATGTAVLARAVNDYAAEIPDDDWVPGGPIVAYLANGAPMSLRDKGPLWIVYPYDDDTAWQTEVTFARSVWQLDRLEVE